MDFHEFSWILIDSHGFSWIFQAFRVDFYALIDDVINIRGLWNLLDLHVFSWFSIDFQWIFNGFFNGLLMGSHTCKIVQKGPPWGRPKPKASFIWI